MRFVIKYIGDDPKPDTQGLEEVLKVHHGRSIESAGQAKLTLIEMEESAFPSLQASLPVGYVIYREERYKVPATEKSIRDHSQ